MKTKTQKSPRIPSNINDLLGMAQLLLEADLSDPTVEINARKVLVALRKKGYSFFPFDMEEPDCLACLYMGLASAANLIQEFPKIPEDQLLH